jgi:hypothetical protein
MGREFTTNPERLVIGGQQRFGTFAEPLQAINLLDSVITSPLPNSLRPLRLKEWQSMQVINERWFGIVSIFDAKIMALVQAKFYDRETGQKYVYERKVRTTSITHASTMLDSECSYDKRGVMVRFDNHLEADSVRLSIHLPAVGAMPAIVGSWDATMMRGSLHVGSWPFGRGRGAVSHKGMMSVSGALQIGDQEVTFSPGSSVAFLDHHKGFYPYVMRWDWVTVGGVRDGQSLGVNLTNNDGLQADRYNENVLWVDGEPTLLPPVSFERDDSVSPEVWSVRDVDGLIDVTFTVELDGRYEVNALIIKSKYRGPFGRFSGTVTAHDGTVVSLDGLFGMGEAFYLRA